MKTTKTIRIATVYTRKTFDEYKPTTMNFTRWLRVAESLARLGYQVDMVMNRSGGALERTGNLRFVPYAAVDWKEYDVVKTLFHMGFESLADEGGADHPFIISKLGSVVGGSDDEPGVHFFKDERRQLFDLQREIARRSRFVTVLSDGSRRLWEKQHGNGNLLMVPTGVNTEIPAPGRNPYEGFPEKIAVYIGNLNETSQRNVNLMWQKRLNTLGRLLKKKGIRLCLVSRGLVDQIDPVAVTSLGTIENDRIWDYQYFADVGITLAQGKVQHNESSKIYYYLRSGLPVVSEDPIPNNHLIKEANLGFIAEFGDEEGMAHSIGEAVSKRWDRAGAIRYMVTHHTWDRRVLIYQEVIDRGVSQSAGPYRSPSM